MKLRPIAKKRINLTLSGRTANIAGSIGARNAHARLKGIAQINSLRKIPRSLVAPLKTILSTDGRAEVLKKIITMIGNNRDMRFNAELTNIAEYAEKNRTWALLGRTIKTIVILDINNERIHGLAKRLMEHEDSYVNILGIRIAGGLKLNSRDLIILLGDHLENGDEIVRREAIQAFDQLGISGTKK